jgi:peptide chain release factor 2
LAERSRKIAQLEKMTSEPGFWDNNQKAQAILKETTVHKKWVNSHKRLSSELEDTAQLLELTDSEGDDESVAELERSLNDIIAAVGHLEFESLLSGPDDHQSAILAIHPGAGGTESMDWAGMLFRMYKRWIERHGFTTQLMDYQPGDEAGLKSATLEVNGDFVYGHLRAESGVHRLVRISPFDAASRRHTSFASVHVYPVVEDTIEIEIRDEDIRIDTYRASGAGGQHVNKTSSAVRITHQPTGIVVTCQSERSQHKNKESAFRVLKSRLYQHEKEEQAKRMDKFQQSKKKIEWGSQIRSYVFHPYNMVKDHRTQMETGNIQAVMDGDIEKFIDAYLADPELNTELANQSETDDK